MGTNQEVVCTGGAIPASDPHRYHILAEGQRRMPHLCAPMHLGGAPSHGIHPTLVAGEPHAGLHGGLARVHALAYLLLCGEQS